MNNYFQLMRFHKPIGIFLLLYPTLTALWIAGSGHPSIKNIIIFVFGVICMRAAGCVINDYFDRHVDRHVTRTKNRPLAAQKIPTRNALLLFFILCAIAFVLVLFTNAETILLAFFALGVAIIYPLMKRITHWPQLFLSIAFSFSIPMAFTAEINHVPAVAWLLMLINIIWTIAYDTQYALCDRRDDILIGVKSTAILFAKHDKLIIALLQSIVIFLLIFLGILLSAGLFYFSCIAGSALLFFYQAILMRHYEPNDCLRAFINNQWVGLLIFLAVV